jgi:hypothetical protein
LEKHPFGEMALAKWVSAKQISVKSPDPLLTISVIIIFFIINYIKSAIKVTLKATPKGKNYYAKDFTEIASKDSFIFKFFLVSFFFKKDVHQYQLINY